MFDPYADPLSSTGEPPTESSDNSGTGATSARTIEPARTSDQDMSNLSLSSGSSRSLSVQMQEPDSGYEASPSSIADNQRFFGEPNGSRQSEIRQSTRMNSDDEYDIIECHSQILFSDSESELDDYDTCLDCSSSPVSCSCFRTDSSTTNATACDNSRCNSSDLSFIRSSSAPIQIPNRTSEFNSIRLSSEFSSRLVIGSPIDSLLPRSQPSDFSPRLRLGLIPERRVPLSWPSTRNVALSTSSPSNRDIPAMNICRNHHRSRRQIIDSDASSYSSSEEEGPEDVFNLPSGEASSYPTMMTMSSVPLPDVVLESTDSGRRSRSMSINLPPDREQVLNDIGQRLRRMSDLFVQRRQLRMAVMRARSRTASECDDHLHRNGLS